MKDRLSCKLLSLFLLLGVGGSAWAGPVTQVFESDESKKDLPPQPELGTAIEALTRRFSSTSVLSSGIQEGDSCTPPALSRQSSTQNLRFVDRTAGDWYPTDGSKVLVFSEYSKKHSMQHFADTEITTVEQARAYARYRSVTSVLDKKLSMTQVLRSLTLYPESITPDKKPSEVLGDPRITYTAKLLFPNAQNPTADARYKFKIVVCNQKYCNNIIDKTQKSEHRVFRKGDIISIFPVCGPLVLSIPPSPKFGTTFPEGVAFPPPGSGIRYEKCWG